MTATTSCTIDAPGRSRGTPAGERGHRGSIFVEDGKLLSQQEYPGQQFVIRVQAPRCAAAATPGSFAHLTCDPDRPMRRPLSLMRVDPKAGWIEILYKVVGPGLESLARQPLGATISVLGPIGKGFVANPRRPRTLLVGGGVGIPADGLPGRVVEAAPRRGRLAAPGADGLRDRVSLPRASIADRGPGHSERGDCMHAAAGRLGHRQPAGELR